MKLQPIGIFFGGSKHKLLLKPSKGRTDTLRPTFWAWRTDTRSMWQAPIDLWEQRSEVVFKGPERHVRLNVKGWPEAWHAMCGANIQGWGTAAPLANGEHESQRIATVCENCTAVLDALEERWEDQ